MVFFKKSNNQYSILNIIKILFIFILLYSSILIAEERIITLPNGAKLTANTSFGRPDRFHNDYLRITEIRPVLGILQEWRLSRLTWTIKFVAKDPKTRGLMLIESPLNPDDKTVVPIYINAPYGYSEGIIVEFFNKSTHPKEWHFLSEKGDDWIPFNIQVILEEPKTNFTFVQWARVSPKEKSIFLAYEKAVQDRFEKLPTQSIFLANGSKYEIKTENGAPLRYVDLNIQVDNMCPAFDGNSKKEVDPWIWVMTGKVWGLGSCKMEILDTSLDGKRLAEFYIKDNGRWNIVFAEKSRHSEYWQWENESKDEWIVVKVRLTVQSTGEIREWYESCLINNNVRKALSKHTH
jgi:hypothetical protein